MLEKGLEMEINIENKEKKSEKLLYINQFLMCFSNELYMFIMPIALYGIFHSQIVISNMKSFEIIPTLILGIISGIIIDGHERRYVAKVSIILQFTSIMFIGILVFNKLDYSLLYYVVGFVSSLSAKTFGIIQKTTAPFISEKTDLSRVNSNLYFISALLGIFIPLLVGVVLKYTADFIIIVATGCIILVQILFLDNYESSVESKAKKNLKKNSFISGLKMILANQKLRISTIVISLDNLATCMTYGILVFYMKDVLKATTSDIGLVFSISSVGALIGAIGLKKILKNSNEGYIFLIAYTLNILTFIILIFTDIYIGVAIALFIKSISSTLLNISYSTVRQKESTSENIGNITGITSLILKLLVPLGYFMGGQISFYFGFNNLFKISLLLMVICILVSYLNRKKF